MSALQAAGDATSPRQRDRISESGSETEVEVHFEPLVTLPEVEISTNEENEEIIFKCRAKLFRFDTSNPEEPEWKERGTGEVKLLRHLENNSVRVVMRRDKTLKICANHFITPWMDLKPSCGSNRAWVWTVPADFADETPKAECLAIRFASPEIASQWKEKFEDAKRILRTECELYKEDYVKDVDKSLESESSSNNDDDDDDDDVEDEKEKKEIVDTPSKDNEDKESTDEKTVIKKIINLDIAN